MPLSSDNFPVLFCRWQSCLEGECSLWFQTDLPKEALGEIQAWTFLVFQFVWFSLPSKHSRLVDLASCFEDLNWESCLRCNSDLEKCLVCHTLYTRHTPQGASMSCAHSTKWFPASKKYPDGFSGVHKHVIINKIHLRTLFQENAHCSQAVPLYSRRGPDFAWRAVVSQSPWV